MNKSTCPNIKGVHSFGIGKQNTISDLSCKNVCRRIPHGKLSMVARDNRTCIDSLNSFFFFSHFTTETTNLSRQFIQRRCIKKKKFSIFINFLKPEHWMRVKIWIPKVSAMNNDDTRGAVERISLLKENIHLKYVFILCFCCFYLVFYTQNERLKPEHRCWHLYDRVLCFIYNDSIYLKSCVRVFIASVHKIQEILIPSVVRETPILLTFTLTCLLWSNSYDSIFVCDNCIQFYVGSKYSLITYSLIRYINCTIM